MPGVLGCSLDFVSVPFPDRMTDFGSRWCPPYCCMLHPKIPLDHNPQKNTLLLPTTVLPP